MKVRLDSWLRLGVLGMLLLLTAAPFAFLFINSWKTIPEFYVDPWRPIWPPHPDNYAEAWAHLRLYVANSLVTTGVTLCAVLAFVTLAAYAFARLEFPGRHILYKLVISLMLVPGVLMLVPSFLWARELQLLDTRAALYLFYIASGQVVGIFLMRQAFMAIPDELFEAAYLDGASAWQALRFVGLPMVRPTLATVAILVGLSTWNNFLWPLVTTNRAELKLVTNGILDFSAEIGASYGVMFAGYVISAVPMLLVILVTMRSFVRGLSAGASKG